MERSTLQKVIIIRGSIKMDNLMDRDYMYGGVGIGMRGSFRMDYVGEQVFGNRKLSKEFLFIGGNIKMTRRMGRVIIDSSTEQSMLVILLMI